ncbi:glyoxalase superfamily protein [Pseudemcibacter aquimaris]|uniref:glyoxalase superfamily protein n=1 Tax=Pseudemcibacter aquimaris TaxID=2857064 RepID=UPI00201222F7|nr:glyoxalase superfamily protein [Pseudemcibacter aquimaris]MCC3859581.1 hypothetical protein [Pseudemcibacter aquimaris]WDU59977.1 hypothetical protein KW060_06870 [Pseudemcibacter aquimaris]
MNIENLKSQAKRLREYLSDQNIKLSHSAALEAIAKQHGYRDWNTLSASIKSNVKWPAVGDRVMGTYLGHNFRGTILNSSVISNSENRRYTVMMDEAIDVVKSELFSNFRQRISSTINGDLRSVDYKGNPDNILNIQ